MNNNNPATNLLDVHCAMYPTRIRMLVTRNIIWGSTYKRCHKQLIKLTINKHMPESPFWHWCVNKTVVVYLFIFQWSPLLMQIVQLLPLSTTTSHHILQPTIQYTSLPQLLPQKSPSTSTHRKAKAKTKNVHKSSFSWSDDRPNQCLDFRKELSGQFLFNFLKLGLEIVKRGKLSQLICCCLDRKGF